MTLRLAALETTRDWSPAKANMAIRAAGLDRDGEREALEIIATEWGVSRETARRARNELLALLEARLGSIASSSHSLADLILPSQTAREESPATARALRRMLTMTGPLAWDEVLAAWARAGGRHPYSQLPRDMPSLRAWVREAGGFRIYQGPGDVATIDVESAEELDQVSRFLFETLRDKTSGIERGELFVAAENTGLKSTTIATTLSQHPAVMRLGRGTWALRGSRGGGVPGRARAARRPPRIRPTSFSWDPDGSLKIEFSIPRGPSPVVAIPKAIAEIVEGREFGVESSAKPTHLSVRNARLWGFGPLVSEMGLAGGSRAAVALNLIRSTATFRSVEREEP